MAGLSNETGEATSPSDIKSPGSGGTTALSLLTAFTRLINGGKELTPHLLGSLWEDGKQLEVSYGQTGSGSAVREEISHALLSVLRNSGPAKANGQLFFESAQLEAAGPQESDFGLSPEEGGPEVKSEAQAILLGMAPQKMPEISLVIVLDGAQLNFSEPSPLRQMAKGLAPRALKIARTKTAGLRGPSAPEENKYYEKWLALQPKADERSVLRPDMQKERMPDVRGYSVRKALQTLQDYGLKIAIKGSGRVASQHPAPGASLRGVEECRLELRKDN